MIVVSFALLALCSSAPAENIGPYYHDQTGIPAAEAIRKIETSRQVWRGLYTSRIVGGVPSFTGEHPYFAGLLISLNTGRTSVCGASLVTNTRLVTAAHCWRDARNQGRNLTVVLASTTLFFGGTRISTSDVITHAAYNSRTLRNDIAIANTLYKIRPISLPSLSLLNDTLSGRRAQVTDFGRTSDTDRITPLQTLHDVFVTLMTNWECAGVYGNVVYDGVVCSSGTAGRGSCGGDSGGPLTVFENRQNVLVGVVSFGSARGCQVGQPSGFTRVSYFLDWIQSRL